MFTAHEIYSDARGHRYMFLQLHIKLNQWAEQNKQYLGDIIDRKVSPNDKLRDSLIELHKNSLETFITDYSTWSIMETYGNIRTCPSINMFTELSRTHFIIMYNKITEESDKIKRYHTSNLPSPSDFMILYNLEKSKYFEVNYKMAIMSYKQTDIMNALLMLSEKIDQLPFDAFEELKTILNILYTRNSILLCQHTSEEVLDCENMNVKGENMPNRDYITFCTIYFHVIQRRIFYTESIKTCSIYGISPDSIERCRKWVEDDVCIGLGGEGFDDCQAKSCEEAYKFPGDYEWFKYRYSNLSAQTGPILDCFRKPFSKKYYSSYRISKEVILSAVNQTSHQGAISRIFVINAVDQYMRSHFSIPWRDGIVIDNNAIEGSDVKLYRNHAPYLLQIFSRYYVYHDNTIYVSDCIYEAITFWMYLLKIKYNSEIFSNSIISLTTQILEDAKSAAFKSNF